MLSFECIKNEKSVYFLLTSAKAKTLFLFTIEARIGTINKNRIKRGILYEI